MQESNQRSMTKRPEKGRAVVVTLQVALTEEGLLEARLASKIGMRLTPIVLQSWCDYSDRTNERYGEWMDDVVEAVGRAIAFAT